MKDSEPGRVEKLLEGFRAMSLEEQELFEQSAHDLLWKRHNSSVHTLKVFQRFYKASMDYGLKVSGAAILEIGGGCPLGTGLFWMAAGAGLYVSVEKHYQVNLNELWLKRFSTLLQMASWGREDFNVRNFVEGQGEGMSLNEDRIRLLVGDFETCPLEEDAFDFVYSHAVLEHVADLERVAGKISRILRPGGLTLHEIDLREHNTHLGKPADKNTSVDFLKYSKEEWEERFPPGSLAYVNRLRAGDYRRIFSGAGLRVVEMKTTRRMELDESVYRLIHADFAGYGLNDLRATGLYLICTKD